MRGRARSSFFVKRIKIEGRGGGRGWREAKVDTGGDLGEIWGRFGGGERGKLKKMQKKSNKQIAKIVLIL